MKKIISLVAAAAMMLTASATAFAAVTYPENSDAPKMIAHYEKISEADGYSKVEITFDLTDLGDLNAEFANRKESGVQLASIAVNIGTPDGEVDLSMVTETGSVNEAVKNLGFANAAAFANSSVRTDFKGINIVASAGTTVGLAYPNASSTTTLVKTNELDNAFTLVFETTATEINLSEAIVTYLKFTNSAIDAAGNENAPRNVTIVNPTWTIGDDCDCDECNPPVVEKELELTIDEGTVYYADEAKEQVTGTVWNCTIANAANALKKLEVTFTDSEGATENFFTTKGIGAWGGAGKTEFAIGVKSATRTVNAISATITDVEGATATDTAAAN